MGLLRFFSLEVLDVVIGAWSVMFCVMGVEFFKMFV